VRLVKTLLVTIVIAVGLSGSVHLEGQTATVAPGDNLVTDGIPPIAASLAAEVERYTEARSAVFADWHPTRREMLISTRFASVPQVHLVKTPQGTRSQLTFLNEPITLATYQPTKGDYFVFSRDEGGDEFTQFYRYDFADGKIARLTEGGRSQNGAWVWSRRGDRLAYRSTRRNGTDFDLYVMNPLDSRSDRIIAQLSGGRWSPLDWSPDDAQILALQYISINHSNLWLVDVASGTKTNLTPLEAQVSYGGGRFSVDGRGVYLTSDQDSEFRRLAYMDIGTRAVTTLTPDINWDVEQFQLSPDRRTLAFVTNEAGASKVYLLDTSTRRYRAVDTVPIGRMLGLSWHRTGREVGFALTANGAPTDVYSLDVRTGALTRWTESELGAITTAQLTTPSLVRWKSFDGREISGFYYHPPSRFVGKRPVLVYIHGGPEEQFRPQFLSRYNFFLQELGVALVFPNVRGSSGYGKTFLQLDNATRREDAVKDVGALLDWIASQSQLDASRVMVTGESYGGYMTLAVATNYADRIRCTVDIVGISNFNTFLKDTESYRRDLRRVEYGDERDPAIAAFFERISPLTNASRITKPLFVIAGGNDPRVPRTESEQMVARVKQNATPVWYLMAKDEGHGFRKKSNVDFQFYATVAFVRRYLLDQPSGTTTP
jgi:dipeptidyl aminopeptidase/acylaminoacyl peptidase